jgi:D-arabinose 1-dehydrogenase-like Zn-dependent alcohol dehydrogenase
MMKAVVVYGPGDVCDQELLTPPLGPRGVRVEVKASGVCSSK